MTAFVQGLDVPGFEREIHLPAPIAFAPGPDGAVPVQMQDGYPVATFWVIGRNGAHKGTMFLTADRLRQLAIYAERYAAFLDARAKGLPGPCLCTAWVRAEEPCPNEARMDYAMCAECWPDGDARNNVPGGQSALGMSHHHPQPEPEDPGIARETARIERKKALADKAARRA